MKLKILSIALFALQVSCSSIGRAPAGNIVLNDIHSKLNGTRVEELVTPRTVEDIQNAVREALEKKLKISISGGKHSMGGQQFGEGNLHLDMSEFNEVHSLDRVNGVVEVDSGVQWPKLIEWLNEEQKSDVKRWVIKQKQTGADRLSIGGALSSNIHGRGLTLKPMIQDVESFTLVDAKGDLINCSRSENKELFNLVIGGYGLFGVIARVRVRLMPRERLLRNVAVIDSSEVTQKVEERIGEGYLYGDFQFSTDDKSENFLKKGVFSFYKPVVVEENLEEASKKLSPADWVKLITLGHTNKNEAYNLYSNYYLETNGQTYWSDTHQLSTYLDDYHDIIDQALSAPVKGSEMISEVYVPRDRLEDFLVAARSQFKEHGVNVIYGTVRFIKQDDESFLPWAKESYASIVFNFHVDHTEVYIEKTKNDYRRLFDLALSYGGNFFLTYHRWATKEQMMRGYPQFVDFLKRKKDFDSNEVFESDWYRHYKRMFAVELAAQ